jgi:thioredoxin 1
MKVITDSKVFLEEIKDSDKLFVLDFYADWCGPCKRLTPELEKIAEAHKTVVFYKINVDDHEELTTLYNIQCMPTIIFIKKKDEVVRIEGVNITNIIKTIELYK